MEFGVLGPLEVRRDGTAVSIGSRMQRRLLALLLLHAGRPLDADRMIDVLWEGAPPQSAGSGLHTYVSRLRRLLDDGAEIGSDASGYWLDLDEHDLDARRFEMLVASAREHPGDPVRSAARFAEALALWRGAAYAEFAHESFARPEAVRLDELHLAATEDAFVARLAADDPGVIPDLERFTVANPLRERPHIQLMTALSRAGRQTEGLALYQRMRSRLADELGLEPSPTMQRLQTDVLRQAPDVTARTITPDAEAAVATTGATTAVAAVAAVAARSLGNLPQPVTSFLGRRHETDAVCRLLGRDRLVTLTGVGGVGKTRLALEAATSVSADHPDGTWWCELAPADAESIGHTIAGVLGVQQQANQTIGHSLLTALADKRLLLVLDNCEHVVDACAQLATHILRSCPRVTILATSREPLAADGEQVWLVPPLPLPPDGPTLGTAGADDAPSTQLFHDRAAAHLADFSPDDEAAGAIADICRQLDGLPLAIELAAALVPALEPAEIARRLGQRFRLLTHGPRSDPRHRSLAAVVEWSYQLLDGPEQRLFDRLAVFAGGFTLHAVEGVCSDEQLPAEQVAGLVTGLVGRSMVVVDRTGLPARYHLLETLRQFAAHQLADRGEETRFRARHAAWFVDVAESADRDVRGPAEAAGVRLLEAEFANLRAAHRWAIEHDDADLALRLIGALYVYAIHRLHDEVFVWAEQATALASAGRHPLLPTVLGVTAHGVSHRGDLARTRELAQRALEASPEDDHVDRFAAWHALSATALYEGKLEECRRHTDHAVMAARQQRNAYYLAMEPIHEVLALVYGGQREAGLEAALAHRETAEELGNPNLRAWALYGHAEACGDDDAAQALGLLEDALALAGPVSGRFVEGVARVAMTSLRARHQSPRDALAAFPEVIAHWRRAGDWTHQWTTLRNLVSLLVRLEADEPAALLCGAQRTAETAAPVYGADAQRLSEACATLSDRLGGVRFEALVERGANLDQEDAAELAVTSIADILSPAEPATS